MSEDGHDGGVSLGARGPDEWILDGPAGSRSLHVYRLGRSDWLVSEVGRGNEGRGADFPRALAALADGRERPIWWDGALALLADGSEE